MVIVLGEQGEVVVVMMDRTEPCSSPAVSWSKILLELKNDDAIEDIVR